jgi:tRNA pseudouridine38-40 synthase
VSEEPQDEIVLPEPAPIEGIVRLKLMLAYDGTDFAGWAKQPGLRSVEETLEKAFAQVLRMPVSPRIVCAGRTDAGVHASGQVAHIDVPLDNLFRVSYSREERYELGQQGGIPIVDGLPVLPEVVLAALNRRVNGSMGRNTDIVIHTITVAPVGFEARFSALARRYEYRLADGLEHLNPITRKFTAFNFYPLDLDLMNEVADLMVGLRDFGAMCKPRPGATTIRELQEFRWIRTDEGVLVATLQADAFCHSMVRSLVGSCVAAGSKLHTVSHVQKLRDQAERTAVFKVMPAHGLTLTEVLYPSDEEVGERAELTRSRRELTDELDIA